MGKQVSQPMWKLLKAPQQSSKRDSAHAGSVGERDNGSSQSDNGLSQSYNGLSQRDNGSSQSYNGLSQSNNGSSQSDNGQARVLTGKPVQLDGWLRKHCLDLHSPEQSWKAWAVVKRIAVIFILLGTSLKAWHVVESSAAIFILRSM